MKIVEPSVEIYNEPDPLKKIETIARVCTGTQDRTGTKPDFLKDLWKRGHETPFEHVRVKVGRLPDEDKPPEECLLDNVLGRYKCDTYGESYRVDYRREDVWNPATKRTKKKFIYALNGRDFLTMGGRLDELAELPEDEQYLTVKFTVDIGVGRELLRHRQMSFMERSTRYYGFQNGLEFVRPVPFKWADGEDRMYSDFYYWRKMCEQADTLYREATARDSSPLPPQEARLFLPMSAATVLYVTGMYHQWADVLNLRLAKGAHPSMRYIMRKLIELPDFPAEILGMVDTEVLENAKSE